MKHKKTITIPAQPAKTVEVDDYATCDFCKLQIIVRSCEVNQVQVHYETGVRYEDGTGNTTKMSVDMCGNCFQDKLVPWFRSKGITPIVEEWDKMV